MSIYLSIDNKSCFTSYLSISSDGLMVINNGTITYQVLATSRLSFVGCWLNLKCTGEVINPSNKTVPIMLTELFIYKDSVSEQDYARLVSMLNRLSNK